jgi:2-octaprenyl-6-methoxyphenol hydroxylase
MDIKQQSATTNVAAEVAVVGGGLAGLAAAAASVDAGFDTVHVAPPAPADRRTSALMMPSVEALQGLGLIDRPETLGHPLAAIRIIDATRRLFRAPETYFEATETGLQAFGWNFANRTLTEQFASILAANPKYRVVASPIKAMSRDAAGHMLTAADGTTIAADLVVGADGKSSLVRGHGPFKVTEHRFSVAALVCDLELARPIGTTSVEFHYENGPFTLVPAGGNRANLVWIDAIADLTAARELAPEALRDRLEAKAQRLFGRIEVVSPTVVFPLSTLAVDRAGADGIILVGESAHAFPPIGAQGLNLGIRDAAALSSVLGGVDRTAPDWAMTASADFGRQRQGDLGRTTATVEALFRSLLNDFLPVQAVRALGLWSLRASPLLRRGAFSLGMGQQ